MRKPIYLGPVGSALATATVFVLTQIAPAQTADTVADQILARPGVALNENAVQAIFAVHGAAEIA